MSKSSNQIMNPNAREAMDRFKMEAASEVGVNLKNGYNGDLTSKQAGSISVMIAFSTTLLSVVLSATSTTTKSFCLKLLLLSALPFLS